MSICPCQGYISTNMFFNLFHAGFCAPYISNPNYLLLVDFRTREEFDDCRQEWPDLVTKFYTDSPRFGNKPNKSVRSNFRIYTARHCEDVDVDWQNCTYNGEGGSQVWGRTKPFAQIWLFGFRFMRILCDSFLRLRWHGLGQYSFRHVQSLQASPKAEGLVTYINSFIILGLKFLFFSWTFYAFSAVSKVFAQNSPTWFASGR